MIVLTTSGEPVRLAREALVLGRTRLLERDGLKVAGRDGLAVVPTNLQRSYTHFWDAIWECRRGGEGRRQE